MNGHDDHHVAPDDGDDDTSLSNSYRSRNQQEGSPPPSYAKDLAGEDGLPEWGCISPRPGPIDPSTGERTTVRCRRQVCPDCCRVIAHRTGDAIERAKPTHFLTLTWCGSSWPEVRRNLTQFTRAMRKSLGRHDWEWVWHVHRDPNGEGQTHVHAFVRTTCHRRDLVAEKAAAVGMGVIVQFDEIRGESFEYGLHPILDTHGLPNSEAKPVIDEYLTDNNLRLVHASHNFWRDRYGLPSTLKDERRATSGPTANYPEPDQ